VDISDYIIKVVALCCLHENSQATFVYVKSPYLPCNGVYHNVKSNSVNKIRSGKTKLFWTCEHYLLVSVEYMPSQMLASSGDERMKNFF
jgi:hypothetical protein